MKKLLFITLLATLLTGCMKREAPPGILLPTYACTITPTGSVGTKEEQVYCGRACTRTEDYPVHEVRITCEHKEWRRQ